MKGIMYAGATVLMGTGLMIGIASINSSQAVLSPDAPAVLSQTGNLPVSVQRGNPYGSALAITLALAGVGLGAIASSSGQPRLLPQTQQSGDRALEGLREQVRQQALEDDGLRAALREREVAELLNRLGLQNQRVNVDADQIRAIVQQVLMEQSTASPSGPPKTTAVKVVKTVEEVAEKQRQKKSGSAPDPLKRPEYQWITEFLEYPSKWVFGAQGSGKTSKGGFVAQEGVKRGWQVEYINPYKKSSEFEGLKVWGIALNYRDAGLGLKAFASEAKRRIRKRSDTDGYDPLKDERHYMMLCEEMTNWEAHINKDILKDFIEVCTQALRQANMSVVFISHGDTLTCIGGSAGRGKKDVLMNQFMRLQCLPMTDTKVPGGLRCSGQAVLYRPNAAPETVVVPNWMVGPPNYDYRKLVAQYGEFDSPGLDDEDLWAAPPSNVVAIRPGAS